MTRRPHVYLDVETTGLDPDRHEIWEIAYAVDDGPILSGFVPHKRVTLNAETIAACRINGYLDRCPDRVMRSAPVKPDDIDEHYDYVFDREVMEVVEGATMVAANPAFDAAMLRARWGVAPWHYRMLDIEAYAAGVLGWDEMRGLAAIAEHLGVDAPDHTAAGDVYTLRECHRRLRDLSTGVGVDK